MLTPFDVFAGRPAATAISLWILTVAVTIATAGLLALVSPQLDMMTQRFIAVLLLAVFAVVVVLVRKPRLLRNGSFPPALLVLPLLVVLAPFAGGLKDESAQAVVVLVIGYLATGVYEELWFRGLVLDALRTWSPLRAALLSSALFGLAHLSNIAFGANVAVTAAQVVGAACYGVGLAGLRLRGLALWPLILIHAVTDIALALGNVTAGWRWGLMIGGDTALLFFGLFVLGALRVRAAERSRPAVDTSAPRGHL
ncbi:CPBP family intramembrane glutamic endopeptidase [Leifsonia sp. fls2-241-R2A-40a]|uniref:CPBP family intramembrane glutamic endopeptidase n=1 Tax=Leifsonia sp. fls2-241-R2A-40a TaxID=3040290 RepID=UPI00254CA830|nr:CPBP family intramembrane glutamic endopeptidase [Leifsonia sp. fls2-241-R2A-40a]